jgi:formate-dependent nitrite reductase cytochrome c552 subunit
VVLVGLSPGAASQADELNDEEIAKYKEAWSTAVDHVTPDGYLYEELHRCAGCHETAGGSAGNSTHRNAIGIAGDPSAPTLTGKGWLSGAHGRSQDSAVVSNTYCAWCHAPSQPGVNDDIGAGQPIDSGRTGVSCIACHMAVYNVTESGRSERYHNMKVAANHDAAACRPCHDYADAEVSMRCAELVPSFSSLAHAVPEFE